MPEWVSLVCEVRLEYSLFEGYAGHVFNADPNIIPCLAKGISTGRFVDLAWAYSVGPGMEPDALCKCKLDEPSTVSISSEMPGVLVLRLVFVVLFRRRETPSLLAIGPFWDVVLCRFGVGDLVVGLLVVLVPERGKESVRVMMLLWRRLSILSTPYLLLCCFFDVGLSRLLIYLQVSGGTASLRVGGMPCFVGGRL